MRFMQLRNKEKNKIASRKQRSETEIFMSIFKCTHYVFLRSDLAKGLHLITAILWNHLV